MNRLLPIWLLLFAIAASLTSCNDRPATKTPAKKTEAIKPPKKKAVKKHTPAKKKEVSYPVLTNDNVVKFLTKYGQENKETVLKLTCKYGEIVMRLYTNTPLHRADMIYLTKRGYFDHTQFYRVSKDFVVQAGNSDDWETQELRAKIGSYTLPAEMNNDNFHKYGAVAMARRYDKNPNKRSSPYEFYISLGRKYSSAELDAIERELGIEFNPLQRKTYMTIGGNPFLDKQHTVIGEVISGMDVALEINKVKVDRSEWPLEEIGIKMEVVR